MTFADKVITFNRNLHYTGKTLPKGIRVMNPFRESPEVMPVVEQFYGKYYNDHRKRHLILGINPGRFGAGATGIPFTDPKRLASECGISFGGKVTHEPSSVFIYDVINAYGGPESFYGDFFINSPCPLGFTTASGEKETNYNYYDSKELLAAVDEYILQNIKSLIALGIYTDVCFCFGTGKNFDYLSRKNEEHKFFDTLIPLEHPRFIMQYKSRQKDQYILKYINAFSMVRA
jgi:hypothetical protein